MSRYNPVFLNTSSTSNLDWVNVKDFGATGDGSSDDTAEIQTAINSVSGGTIYFPVGTYKISAPLQIKRGVTLRGATTFDDITNHSSKLFLANAANCSMVVTPAGAGGSGTHYMAIENLLLDGNKANQTTENAVIKFWGAWVGSWIRNVAIQNSYGSAISLGSGADVELSHIWINETTTTGYALEINNGSSSSDGLVSMHDIYVEKTTNIKADPYVPANRGKAFLANKVVALSIDNIHFENAVVGLDVANCGTVNIGRMSFAHGGDPARESAMVRFLDDQTRIFKLESAVMANAPSSNFNMVMPTSGVSSNELKTVPLGNGFIANYVYAQDGWSDYYLPQNVSLLNQLRILANGGWSEQRLLVQTDPSNEDRYHFIKGLAEVFGIGTRFDKAADKNIITVTSGGANAAADRIELGGALYLEDRADAGYAESGAIFTIGGIPVIAKGSNAFERIVTTKTGSGPPTTSAEYLGQDYIDTSAQSAYKAINIGTGSSDWKQTTP